MEQKRNVLFQGVNATQPEEKGYTLFNPNRDEGRFHTTLQGLAKLCAQESFLQETDASLNYEGNGVTTIVAPVVKKNYFEKPVNFSEMQQFMKLYHLFKR